MKIVKNKIKNSEKEKTVFWCGKQYKCKDYHLNSDGTITLYCGTIIRTLEKEPAIYVAFNG